MRPTEILSAEHRVIEGVLSCLDAMAARTERGVPLDVASAQQAIEFLRTFADTCHHGKEERHLFQTLIAKGWPADSGPVGVMLSEHEQGRGLIRRMALACDLAETDAGQASKDFAEAARAYAMLLREHIFQEDHVLFAMADRALDAAEQQELLARFEAAEAEEIGPDTHERMLAIARELAGRFSSDASAATAGTAQVPSHN
jgi:hemerythrin-like domain-containing protein